MKTDFTSADRLAELVEHIGVTAEVLGQEITGLAAEVMANDLAEYSDELIAGALTLCRRELTGKLTLAAIIERIARADGYPTANEAWAIALESSDENNSTFLLDEINRALLVARPVLDAGDRVGARMAFIDAYNRSVDQARREGRRAKWSLSPGWDPDKRQQAIVQAQIEGRISKYESELLLEEHCAKPIDAGKLLENSASTADAETAIRHLDELKNIVSFSSARSRQARIMTAERQRAEFERHKASELERLHQHYESKGVKHEN